MVRGERVLQQNGSSGIDEADRCFGPADVYANSIFQVSYLHYTVNRNLTNLTK
ncbi:hypothetical protein D1872_319500 [compost metagenome]